MPTSQLTGVAFDVASRKGLADLRAEVWGRIEEGEKQLAVATTDAEGRFLLTFELGDKAIERKPYGFLKIFFGDTLLHTTKEELIETWIAGRPPFLIELTTSPKPTDEMPLRLIVAVIMSDGEPAAGVQFIMRYDLPNGQSWTSNPQSTGPEGRLVLDLPVSNPDAIDWSRAHFAFSKNDRLLTITDRSDPQPTHGGIGMVFHLAQESIPWPPEQDPNKWYIRGRVTTPNSEPVMANVSASGKKKRSGFYFITFIIWGWGVVTRSKIDELPGLYPP